MDEMMPLNVSNLVIRNAPVIGPGGTAQQQTTVTFMVGTHGPFVLTFPAGAPTPAEILAEIAKTVQQVKVLQDSVSALNKQTALSP